MVHTDLEHAFGSHRDTVHHESSDNSITFHVSAWVSRDCLPSDSASGTWIKCASRKPIRHKEGNIVGYFGEI